MSEVRIAALEAEVAGLRLQVEQLKETVDLLSEHCPDRNDLQRRFQLIVNAISQISPPDQRSLFEKVFGI